jgi:hypothetical protein
MKVFGVFQVFHKNPPQKVFFKERITAMTDFRSCASAMTANLGWLKDKAFGNPGRTYNTGNTLAIGGAVAQVVAASPDLLTLAHGLTTQFMGNLPSVLITLGSLVFFHSGWNYDQAWANGFPPDAKKNDNGHKGSVAGATLLAAGLYGLAQSDTALLAAVVGGTMHAGGKLGSLIEPEHDATYKFFPLISRAPAGASLMLDILDGMSKYPHFMEGAKHSILPAFVIAANIVWARADTMLMPEGPVKRVLSRALLVPEISG